jgi:PAS domain S-box-containing protein
VLYSCRPYGDFGTTFVSENVAALFGHPARNYLQSSGFWMDHIHPDDRGRVVSQVTREIPTGRTFAEYRFRHADGMYRFVRDSAVVVRDKGGKCVEMVGHMMDVTREKEAEEERREHDRLKYFSEALLSAQEAERRRVSRELHDDLNQRLAALILEMGVLERNLHESPHQARRTCSALKAQVGEISDDVRRIALQLHSAGLEQFGLRATLKQECASIADRSGLKIQFRSRGVPEAIPENVSLCLYRVAQECLRNVVKHSKASQAAVTLTGARDCIRLLVEDRGIGFSPEEARTRMTLGLISMNERLRQVEGTLKLDSEPGAGARIEVRVPLP